MFANLIFVVMLTTLWSQAASNDCGDVERLDTIESSVVNDTLRNCINKGCVCERFGNAVLETCTVCAQGESDLFFVVDSSRSSGRNGFEKELTFVKDVITHFDLNTTRVSVTTYDYAAYPIIRLGQHTDQSDVFSTIDSAEYLGGGTNTAEALEYMRIEALTKSENRLKVALVITYGDSYHKPLTIHESRLTHRAGIVVYAVGIGPNITLPVLSELQHIASDPDDQYVSTIDNFRAFDAIKKKFAKVTCEDKETWIASDMEHDTCPPCCECIWYTDGLHVTCNCSSLPSIPKNLRNATRYLFMTGPRSKLSSEYKTLFNETPNLRQLIIRDFTLKTFANILDKLTQLEELDIGDNRYLTDIDANVFSNLLHLRKIRFWKMELLEISMFRKALESIRSKQVDTLVIDFIGYTSLPALTADFFAPLKNSQKLTKLVLANLNIGQYELDFTKHIRSVSCFILSGHGITKNLLATIYEVSKLPFLRVMDISNVFPKEPTTQSLVKLCSVCDSPLSRSTKVDKLSNQTIHKYHDKNCGITLYTRNIEYVYLKNYDRYVEFLPYRDILNGSRSDVYLDKLCVNYNNQIRYVDLSNSYISRYGLMRVYGFFHLQYLNMQNGHFSDIRFSYLPSLETLLMGNNNFESVFNSGNATYALTESTPHLSSIDVAGCKISHISQEDFHFLSQIKFVNMSNNKINSQTLNYDIDFKFHFLNLATNNIDQLQEKFRTSFDKHVTKPQWTKPVKNVANLPINMLEYTLPIIDLSDNQFICSCETLPFLEWFQNRINHFYTAAEYTCKYKTNRTSMHNLNLTKMDCAPRNQKPPTYKQIITVRAVVGGTIAIALISIIVMVSYRYKRQLRYYLCFRTYIHVRIALYKRLAQAYLQLVEENANKYDVFILCSGDDLQIARNEIKPGLIRRGFTVTTSDDDFVPGRSIPEEIERSLASSTCALLLLSNKFLHSPWLNYEVTMAIAMKRRVIMVKLDDPPHRLLPPALIYLYNTHQTRQRYPKDRPDDLPRFWSNLTGALTKLKTDRF